MNIEKFYLKNETIKFLRFCKNFDLYNSLILKYKNSAYLESTLSYYTIKNYVYCLQNKVCMLSVNKQNLTLDLLCEYWEEFAYDLIEEEEKRNVQMKNLCEQIKNQRNLYKQIMYNSFYGSNSNIDYLNCFYEFLDNQDSTR